MITRSNNLDRCHLQYIKCLSVAKRPEPILMISKIYTSSNRCKGASSTKLGTSPWISLSRFVQLVTQHQRCFENWDCNMNMLYHNRPTVTTTTTTETWTHPNLTMWVHIHSLCSTRHLLTSTAPRDSWLYTLQSLRSSSSSHEWRCCWCCERSHT
jgi:hypothetical protein